MTFNEERVRLLLPQITLFFKSWIPQVRQPSTELNALLYYTSVIVEAAFKVDFHVLSLFEVFMSLPTSDDTSFTSTIATYVYQVLIELACDAGNLNCSRVYQ